VDITCNTFYECTATFRTQICRKCLRIKLNGLKPVSTLVDITCNTFYECTATFRTHCTYAVFSTAFFCNDTHCTRQKAHASCPYGVINVSVQVTIRPRTWQCLRVGHHHLFPRPESIFDKRQLRSEAIRFGMDVYGERVVAVDSHETWH
jgi:hypothetical protein